jgi:dTDP-4-amino-4,6-dideoxygalactose transaminase
MSLHIWTQIIHNKRIVNDFYMIHDYIKIGIINIKRSDAVLTNGRTRSLQTVRRGPYKQSDAVLTNSQTRSLQTVGRGPYKRSDAVLTPSRIFLSHSNTNTFTGNTL